MECPVCNKAKIEEERNKEQTHDVAKNPLTEKEAVKKHSLWKEGDPKENSMAFFLKYDCHNYSELKSKQPSI